MTQKATRRRRRFPNRQKRTKNKQKYGPRRAGPAWPAGARSLPEMLSEISGQPSEISGQPSEISGQPSETIEDNHYRSWRQGPPPPRARRVWGGAAIGDNRSELAAGPTRTASVGRVRVRGPCTARAGAACVRARRARARCVCVRPRARSESWRSGAPPAVPWRATASENNSENDSENDAETARKIRGK